MSINEPSIPHFSDPSTLNKPEAEPLENASRKNRLPVPQRRICYVFCRYARAAQDGRQSQFFKFVPLLKTIFAHVEILGLAKDPSDLAGALPQFGPGVNLEEILLPGSYAIQVPIGIVAGRIPLPFAGWSKMRHWIESRDNVETVFFFEGFPLAGYLSLPKQARVFWGETDSYLRRARRMRTAGVRNGFSASLETFVAYWTERFALRAAQGVHVCSEKDARFLRYVHKSDNITCIPILFEVTTAHRALLEQRWAKPKVLIWADAAHPYLEAGVRATLSFVGTAATNHSANFIFLVGKNEHLKNAILSAGWEAYTRVDKLAPFIDDMDFIVIPDLTGTGLKNRVLYAMSRGVCVIGTAAAWEGIPCEYSKHGILLAQIQHLHLSIERVWQNNLSRIVGNAGLDLVRSYFSSKRVGPLWHHFFDPKNLSQ